MTRSTPTAARDSVVNARPRKQSHDPRYIGCRTIA